MVLSFASHDVSTSGSDKLHINSQPTFPVEGVVHSVPGSECCRGRGVARGQAGVHEGQEGGAGIHPIRSGISWQGEHLYRSVLLCRRTVTISIAG